MRCEKLGRERGGRQRRKRARQSNMPSFLLATEVCSSMHVCLSPAAGVFETHASRITGVGSA